MIHSHRLGELVRDSTRGGLRTARSIVYRGARGSLNLCYRWGRVRHVHVLREQERPFNFFFFHWLRRTHPRLVPRFRHSTTADPAPIDTASLFIPWLQDPVRERSAALFEQVSSVEAAYARAGVPVVNPVRVLSNCIKSVALEKIREAGVRTARSVRLEPDARFGSVADALGVPFIVRNDRGHGGHVRLVRNAREFRTVEWDLLPHPLALEFVDTRGPDGLYRKYRYVFAGDAGVPRHVVITNSWFAHAGDRIRRQESLDEELAYVNRPDPFHDALDAARKALELDFVAFDYGVDQEGRLVVWEPNPFPMLWSRFNARDPYFKYQRPQVDRVFELQLRFYLETACLAEAPAPPRSAVAERGLK